MRHRRSGFSGLCLSLLLSLALVRPVGAQTGLTAETPLRLSASTPQAGDTLTGDRGGAFRYYAFDYPGQAQPVTVRLTVSESFGQVGRLIGFNLYGPAGLVGSGQPLQGDPRATQADLTIAEPAPGRYLVQVFNYLHGATVAFGLTVSGLGQAPPPPPAPAPAGAPVAQDALVAFAGTLTGQASGAFHYLEVDYPGADEPLSATLNIGPPAPGAPAALGMHLYRRGDLVARGQVTEATPLRQTLVLTYQGRSPDRLLLQIFNYAPGHTVSYGLRLTGLAPRPEPAEGHTTPDRARPLDPAHRAYRATLAGRRAGAHHYYLLVHPGGQRLVRLVLSAPGAGAVAAMGALSLYVWDGATLVAQVRAEPDERGDALAILALSADQARTYGLQVSHYGEGQTTPYRLTALGLD